eukprot:UN32239
MEHISFHSNRSKKLVVPLGCMYTPLVRAEDVERIDHNPITCVNKNCNAICNPFCNVDYVQKMWVCNMCNSRNPFPPKHARNLSQDNILIELESESTTVEYSPADVDPLFPPAILFVIDTCNIEDELASLCSCIQQLFSTVPEAVAKDIYVGIITYGKHVQLHEIGFNNSHNCSKVHVFRGNSSDEKSHPTIESLKKQIECDPNNISKFMMPMADAEDVIGDILGNLQKDSWIQRPKHRADRCTGAAIQVAVAFMESVCQGQSGRIMVFSAGA